MFFPQPSRDGFTGGPENPLSNQAPENEKVVFMNLA
jgi:hypothetical protein